MGGLLELGTGTDCGVNKKMKKRLTRYVMRKPKKGKADARQKGNHGHRTGKAAKTGEWARRQLQEKGKIDEAIMSKISTLPRAEQDAIREAVKEHEKKQQGQGRAVRNVDAAQVTLEQKGRSFSVMNLPDVDFSSIFDECLELLDEDGGGRKHSEVASQTLQLFDDYSTAVTLVLGPLSAKVAILRHQLKIFEE